MGGLRQRIYGWLWDRETPTDALQRSLLVVARYSYALLRELSTGELSMRAMSLVYTTMLAFVPLLALSFSVLKGFGYHERLAPLLQSFLDPLGPQSDELTATVIGFVDNVQGSTLAGVSLVLLLLTAVSMVRKVENSFNFVWRVDHPRNIARRLSDYLSVILIGPVLMAVAMGMIARIEGAAVVERLDNTGRLGHLVVSTTELTPYVLVIAAFTFLYTFVPNTSVRFRTALLGGVLAGIIWAGCGEFFATFVAEADRTAIIYSGFAIVIFGMLWLYFSWLILLLGAQFTFLHQNPDYLRLETRMPTVSNEMTERLAINVMVLVGQEAGEWIGGWDLQGLAGRIGVPRHLLKPIVEALEESALLAETTEQRLIPANDIRKISVSDILASVRKSRANGRNAEPDRWTPIVDAVAEQIDSALTEAVHDRSLADLVDAATAPSEGDEV
jgi:membrane protein